MTRLTCRITDPISATAYHQIVAALDSLTSLMATHKTDGQTYIYEVEK